MQHRIITVLFTLSLVFAASSAHAIPTPTCKDAAAYLASVDEQMAQQTSLLFSDADWRAAAQMATAKAATFEDGMGALSYQELEPIVTLWGVPIDTLGSMQEEKIPANVRDLHDSGAEYWALMPELLRMISIDGPFAAFIYIEQIDSLMSRNYSAQVELIEACPGLLDTYQSNMATINDLFEVFDVGGNMDFLVNAPAEEFRGIGVIFLFFAYEEDATGPATTPVS